MNRDEVLRHIEWAVRTKLTRLNLSGNQLSELPAEIGQLTQLQTLTLNDNRLIELPAEIGQLTNLREIHLDNNRLRELPTDIGQLTNLLWLDLSGNQLSELPAEIGQLTNLLWLDLSGNQLSELPAEIGQLPTELADLNISRRTLYALVIMANYNAVEQVRMASDEELLGIHSFGFKSLGEIRGALNQTITATKAYPNPITDRMNQFFGLGISARTEYALATSKYSTIELVQMASDEELLSIRAFDMNSLHEIRYALTSHSEN